MTAYQAGFSTLETETRIDHLPVRGNLPHWLSGTLVRNGPGKFEVGDHKFRHWFDGLAMLHRFSFHKGQVSYANRYLETGSYCKARETGKVSYREFATDPCKSIFQRMFTLFSPDLQTGNNANVNVTRLDNQFIAMTETVAPIEFDLDTLRTVGKLEYADDLDGMVTTAHPHYDFARRETVNYTTQYGASSLYNVYRIPAGGTTRKLVGSVKVKEPGYMHSFGMTEQYIILAEFSVFSNPLKLLLSGRTFAENLEWHPERPSRFLIMRKSDGSIAATVEAEPFFAFHHINAYEGDGNIILDLAAYPDHSIIDSLYLDRVKREGTPHLAKLRRYTIPLNGKQADYEQITDEVIELPRINYARHNGKPYRYTYGTSTRRETPHDFQNQLVKIDTAERSARCWTQPGCYPGEPVFVAAPDAKAEDDGVILTVVLDTQAASSFLLVLDAARFTEIARAEVPHIIPFGFHGQYFS